MHPAPDILHGSYLISEQSPASSHNTPVLSHTRSFNIPIYRPYVKKKFSISAKIFGIFFVQVYEINFGGNNPLKLPRCSLIRALLHRGGRCRSGVPYFLFSYYYNISPQHPSREGLDGDIRAGEGGADGLLGRGADIHADKRVDIRKL